MVIHQIAPSDRGKWNKTWIECHKSIQALPYEVKIWGDEEINHLLKEDDSDFYNVINKCPSIYKWDYARYTIIEKFGGAYFDMDIEVKSDWLSKLSPDETYLVEGYLSSGVEASIIVDQNSYRHPFWMHLKMFIQDRVMRPSRYKNEMRNVLWKTGPLAVTFFVNNWLMEGKSICLLPNRMYQNGEMAVHHYTNSWVEM